MFSCLAVVSMQVANTLGHGEYSSSRDCSGLHYEGSPVGKMVDINGQYRHVTIPAENFSEETLKSGIGFDASNYGYAVVEKSDMVFIPDLDTAVIDPFCSIPTTAL